MQARMSAKAPGFEAGAEGAFHLQVVLLAPRSRRGGTWRAADAAVIPMHALAAAHVDPFSIELAVNTNVFFS
jgi:hypothetical protein